MKLGVSCPFLPVFGVPDYVRFVQEMDERGYDSAWIGEVASIDAISVMTLIATATKRLGVASGVLPVQTRTPVVHALSAATLARIAPGRVTLGLGLSSPAIVGDWNGLTFSPKIGQLREAVHIIRAALAGERVTFEGRFYRVKNFRMMAPPPPAPVKIVLAALGPRALELAGEIADGVLLNWLAPDRVRDALAHLEAGARRAGRSLEGFEIAAFVRTCVTDDRDAARQWLARDITGYAIVPSYADFFRDSGFRPEIDALNTAWKAGDRAGAVTQISSGMLDALGVVGDEASCQARLAEFERAGLTMPVIVPFAPELGGPGDPRPTLLRTMRTFP
jgi:probable F420-dependent oxidoreductase